MKTKATVLILVFAVGALGAELPRASLPPAALALWESRWERDKLDELIGLLERSAPSPDFAFLAQLWYERSTLVPDEEAEACLRRAADYGFRALGLPGFDAGTRLSEGELREVLARTTDPAAILWTAHSWGLLLGRMNPFTAFLSLGKIRAMYERVIALDPGYWGGSGPQAYGALLANLSDYGILFGVKLADAKFYLEWAILLEPTYLENHLALAWEYARRAKDRKLFEDLLRHILEAPLGDWPFWNRHAKAKAAEYLAQADRLFK
ncbi:MAG: TRAP transporter TatT component family protein [Candidatus Bipolaricaulota bacterium]|nr:TRAP transporter TatT component family protein [Candidatus Bipolaricaulota bacterium]